MLLYFVIVCFSPFLTGCNHLTTTALQSLDAILPTADQLLVMMHPLPNPLPRFGYLDIVCYLITHGADPNRGDDNGDTPLLDATIRGHLPVVEYLITTIGVDLNQTNHNGVTALIAAAIAGHLEVVECLVERGCEVERRNRQG